MKATCTFSNNGALIGEVSAFVLSFEADDGTKWIATPFYIVDDAKFDMSNDTDYRQWKKGDFSPIIVPGKQTATYTYFFVIEPRDSPVTLAPRKFHITLLTWSPGDDNPRKQQESTLNMSQNIVTLLSTGAFGTVPFEEIRQMMRKIP